MLTAVKRLLLHLVMQAMAKKNRPRPLPATVTSIAVWQFGGVGDMLLATPVLAALHDHYPNADIHIWCSYPEFAGFLRRLPNVRSVQTFGIYDFDLRTLLQGRIRNSLRTLLSHMRRQQPDMVVNLHHPRQPDWWAVEWLVLSRLRPRYALGFSPDGIRGSALDAWLPSSLVLRQHYTDSFRQLLLKAGIPCGNRTHFPLLRDEQTRARQLLAPASRNTKVCLHMGGRRLRMEDKMWPVDRFIALAQRVVSAGMVPVLIGVASERETGNTVCQAVAEAVNIIGETDIGTLAAVIDAADAFVGHDSGPFHIAVSVDTPAVAICGRPDAEPEYLRYDRERVTVLTANHPENISVEQVHRALTSVRS